MKFGKSVFSSLPRHSPLFSGSPQPLFPTLSLGLLQPSPSFSIFCLFYSRNHHGLRIFSNTQKFFHYYKSSQDGEENMHGLSDESKVGRVSSWSFTVKSEDCRENMNVPDLEKVIAPRDRLFSMILVSPVGYVLRLGTFLCCCASID